MLENLKAFFNGEISFPALKKVVDFSKASLKILNTEGDGNSFVRVDNSSVDRSVNITVNVNSSEIKDAAMLARRISEMIQPHVQEEGKPILEIEASRIVEDLSESGIYQEQIDFFNGKLPNDDLLILRAAYYLRTVHENGKPVTSLKSGITARYGVRGSNIANLCSSGYFETHIRPLYEMLKERPNFTEQMFLENYEIIINNAPFAYFVNSNQTLDVLAKSIKDKLVFSRRYGQHKLMIHAIGVENIKKVNRVLEDETILDLISDEVDTNTKGNVMTATVHHKS